MSESNFYQSHEDFCETTIAADSDKPCMGSEIPTARPERNEARPETTGASRLKVRLMCVTPRYLIDVVNHVAQTNHLGTLIDTDAANAGVKRYEVWCHQKRSDAAPQLDYCEFAAFFAFELVNGSLIASQIRINRVCLALDLMSHIILEHGLMDNFWKVEYDLRTALNMLLAQCGTPEQLLKIFSIQDR